MPTDGKSPSPRLDAAMQMGAIAPKDIIFLANVTPAIEVSKVKGDETLPKGNYLDKKYGRSGYRDYEIHYSVDTQTMQLTPTPDLNYHGRMELVVVVYDDMGQVVNSKATQVPLDVDEASYHHMMRSGLGVDQSIAIPVKGNYFLRMGVYDVSGNKIGTLEVPVDQIKLGLPQSAAVAKP